MARTQTSMYTTLERSTAEDLVCQICLDMLHQCVALQPCGHNFCATCASQYLANLLQVFPLHYAENVIHVLMLMQSSTSNWNVQGTHCSTVATSSR